MTDRLEKLMASLIESGKETDRRLQETDRIVQENALQLEKTRQQMAETDKKLKALGIQVGGIDENQGHHAEQYFQNAFEENPVFGGVKYDEMILNLAHKSRAAEIEFDIALLNGNSIALIEVKNRIHPKFVKKFAEERVQKFKQYFLEFKGYKVYLGIAGFSFSKAVLEEAEKYGIGVVRQVGNSIEMSKKKLKVY